MNAAQSDLKRKILRLKTAATNCKDMELLLVQSGLHNYSAKASVSHNNLSLNFLSNLLVAVQLSSVKNRRGGLSIFHFFSMTPERKN